MHQDDSDLHEDFNRIPASLFILNPGSQVFLGGFLLAEYLCKIESTHRVRKKISGLAKIAMAWLRPNKCHKVEYRKYIRREWGCEQ